MKILELSLTTCYLGLSIIVSHIATIILEMYVNARAAQPECSVNCTGSIRPNEQNKLVIRHSFL